MNEIESIDAKTLKHGRLRLNYNEYIEHDVGVPNGFSYESICILSFIVPTADIPL